MEPINDLPLTPSTNVTRDKHSLVLISGNNHLAFAKGIAKCLGIELAISEIDNFLNGETHVSINESIREKDIFIVQSFATNPNDSLMELLILLDAARRASGRRLTAVIPALGYSRQDKKETSRVPITGKLVANLLEASGAQRILTIDLHTDQLEGFFNVPVDHLPGQKWQLAELERLPSPQVLVAAGVSGVARVSKLAEERGVPLAVGHFGRIQPGAVKSEVVEEDSMRIVGQVEGCHAVIVQDLIDEGLVEADLAAALRRAGAAAVHIVATHGMFAPLAYQRLRPVVDSVAVTNTIPPPEEYLSGSHEGDPPQWEGWLRVVDVTAYFARAIQLIHSMDFPELHH